MEGGREGAEAGTYGLTPLMTFQLQGSFCFRPPRWPNWISSAFSCVSFSPRKWVIGAGSGDMGMAAWFWRQLCFCRMQRANCSNSVDSYWTMQRYRHLGVCVFVN